MAQSDIENTEKGNYILITGYKGLVGRSLWNRFSEMGIQLKGIDLQSEVSEFNGDIRDELKLSQLITNAKGIIHLAAVSRVIWGEHDPDLCWDVNARASSTLISIAEDMPHKPWVIVASSREVYGESELFPVTECSPLRPINVYGHAKLEMENAALKARKNGLNTAVIRLANVYGDTNDHADRVLPAFCKAASEGRDLFVEGPNHIFDFTHISDVTEAFVRLVAKLESGLTDLPPFHFLPGIPTSLMEAAKMAVNAAESSSVIKIAQSRKYDVCRFIGDPSLSYKILGYRASIVPEMGIKMFVNNYNNKGGL